MPAGLRIGDTAKLRCSVYGARAGAVVKIVDTVPMRAGREWVVIESAPGAPTCAVPPEHLCPPEAGPDTGPAARQLQLGGLEMDTLTRPPDQTDPPGYSTPNTLQIIHVPVGAVAPHPQNPRKTFEETALRELAVDISIRGILQPLVVRTLPPPNLGPRRSVAFPFTRESLDAARDDATGAGYFTKVTDGLLLIRPRGADESWHLHLTLDRLEDARRMAPRWREIADIQMARFNSPDLDEDKDAREDAKIDYVLYDGLWQECQEQLLDLGGLPIYQLVAGERRWRAAQLRLPALADDQGAVLRPEWPGLAAVPVIVRDDLSDADVLASMMSENLQRADLNPMEIAAGFKAMQDAGLRQTDIAERLGVSQPAVANALSLLRLPESVQALIAAGRLSASHGRVLVRWAMHPEYCAFVGQHYASHNMPVSTLEQSTIPLRYEAPAAGLLTWLGSGTPFDWQAACLKACPHQAFMRDGEHSGACFHLPCYKEKCKVAKAAQEEEAGRVREQIRQAAAARQAPLSDSPESSDPAEDAPAGAPATPAEESPLLHLEKLDEQVCIVPGRYYPDRGGVTNAALPTRCRKEQCEHYLEGLYNGKPTRACFDPACLQRMHKQAAQDARQQRETEACLLADRARIATNRAAADPASTSFLLAPLVLREIQRTQAAAVRTVFAKMQLPWDAALFINNGYDRPATEAELLDVLATRSVEDLLLIARLCIIETEGRNAASDHDYDRCACRTISWWAGTPLAKDTQELREHYSRLKGEERAQRDTMRATAGLPLLGPADEAPAPTEPAAPPTVAYICTACGTPIPAGHVEAFHTAREYGTDDALWDEDAGEGLHVPSGIAIDGDGSLYCLSCAEAIVPDLWAQRAALQTETPAGQQPGEGTPLEEAGGAAAAEDAAYVWAYHCPSCGREYDRDTADALRVTAGALAAPYYRANGYLVTHGLIYCPDCSPSTQVCRECGCTDESACEGGCSWVGEDLCSACMDASGSQAKQQVDENVVRIDAATFAALRESISCDKIMEGKIRKPVLVDGKLMVGTGGVSGAHHDAVNAMHLCFLEDWTGPTYSYSERVRMADAGEVRRGSGELYEGLLVRERGVSYVLSLPRVTFVPAPVGEEQEPDPPAEEAPQQKCRGCGEPVSFADAVPGWPRQVCYAGVARDVAGNIRLADGSIWCTDCAMERVGCGPRSDCGHCEMPEERPAIQRTANSDPSDPTAAPDPEPESVAPATAHCACCGDEIAERWVTAWTRLSDEARLRLFEREEMACLTMETGEVVTQTGQWYCPDCAGATRICKCCGASAIDREALAEEHSWAADDVCAACAAFDEE